MSKMRFMRVVPAMLLLVALYACSSSGTLEFVQERAQPIPPGKTVALAVSTTSQEEQADEIASRVKSELFGRLVSEGVFKYVHQPDESSDYKMSVRILEAEEVSQTERFWLGAMAGANTVAMNVQLQDEASGDLVTELNVAGESASHPLSSESGVEDAVREAVTQVILALQ